MKNIFGPIHSRRFGTSLGVDLSSSMKQCNFDCLYCELAPAVTVKNQSISVNVEDIISELKENLNDDIDVITLTANGEPTLYPYLDDLLDKIDQIKKNKETLILTNSATLTDEKVFKTLLKLDQVKLSLDSVSEDIFKKIDRPYKDIDIQNIIESIKEFSQVFQGKLYIEILLVKNINDTEDEISKINNVLLNIKNIERVDIGTIDRPPAYGVKGLEFEEIYKLTLLFDKSLPIHIASRKVSSVQKTSFSNEDILNTLDKRPLTIEDIENLFDDNSIKRMKKLYDEKKIITKNVGNLEFFLPFENYKRKMSK